MKAVIYIAGPMRGLPDLGRKNFKAAEICLQARGWAVLNPAILPTDLPEESYMPICLAMLREADAVALLPGWEKSKGAKIEKLYATETGKKIYQIEDLTKWKPDAEEIAT